MLGSYVKDYNWVECLMDQYVILKTCIERINSTMEEQNRTFGFLMAFPFFYLEENLRCLGGYKLNMVAD